MRILLPLFLICSFTVFAQKNTSQIISGAVLLQNKQALDAKSLLQAIRSEWKLKTDSISIQEKTIVFISGNATVMIAQLDYPSDPIELRAAARLSWLWPNASSEALAHQSQAVISVIGPSDKSLAMHQLFTKVCAAVLEQTAAAGVYLSSQYLLLPKGFYSAAAHNMLENQTIPAYCWIYFGRPGKGGAYTFGLQEFGLLEMEVAGSSHDEADVHAAMYDAVTSVLKYQTKLSDSQPVVTEEGRKIPVKKGKSSFLEGLEVYRLEY